MIATEHENRTRNLVPQVAVALHADPLERLGDDIRARYNRRGAGFLSTSALQTFRRSGCRRMAVLSDRPCRDSRLVHRRASRLGSRTNIGPSAKGSARRHTKRCNARYWAEAVNPTSRITAIKIANKTAVPGLNCAHLNLPYIQVLTVQRERQKLGQNCRSRATSIAAGSSQKPDAQR